ncbi:hypothetical protein [Nocardioides pyridinolyticus]
MLLVAGCTAAGPQPPPEDRAASTSCGPLDYRDVRGTPPRWLEKLALDRWPNDEHVCAGVWLRTGNGFVPQGLVVEGRTAWVSGLAASARVSRRYCAVERYDVRTGDQEARLAPVTGQVGQRPSVSCRHGGGLVADEHGLWLVETERLWLLDPDTLDVERAWALLPPLRGSFAVHDDEGRLGIGRWHPWRKAQVDWFDVDELVGSGTLDLSEDLADRHSVAPRATQGAAFDRQPWFAKSVTRCGVLVGPFGRRGFVPGAEGMDLDGDTLWVVSESGTPHYQEQGGRPVVPQLLKIEVRGVRAWDRPQCRV